MASDYADMTHESRASEITPSHRPTIDTSWLDEIAKRYEDRPRTIPIYKRPCPPCPSTKGTDPEVEDILTWPRAAQLDTVFVCGWRQKKNCKGYCDTLATTEEELARHFASAPEEG